MGSSSGQPGARLGDVDTGHPGSGPTAITSGSPNVRYNGKPAARMGDSLAPHHPGRRSIVEGVSSVRINGRPAARVTDKINCGGKMAVGSPNVRIGDNPKLLSRMEITFNPRGRMTVTQPKARFVAPPPVIKMGTLVTTPPQHLVATAPNKQTSPAQKAEEWVVDVTVEDFYDFTLASVSQAPLCQDSCQLWTIEDNGGVYRQSIPLAGKAKAGSDQQVFAVKFTSVIPDHRYACVVAKADGESLVVFEDRLITLSAGAARKQ